jgi:putative endonuclease
MYFVYLIECKDKSIYTGITTNLKRRLEEHKKGVGARYTRARKAVELLYSEKAKNRSAAQKREALIKSWPRKKKLELIHA